MRHSFPGYLIFATGAAMLASCATFTAGIDPAAREAGVTAGAFMYLRGNVEGLRVYRDDHAEPLKIVMQADNSLKGAVRNAGAEAGARGRAQGGVSQTYTVKTEFIPVVYLDRKPHRLRLVRPDGSQAVVDVKPHVGKRYVVVDWLLFAPTLGTSLLIDAMTGKWKMFREINVDAAFASRAAAGTSSTLRDTP